MLTLEALRALRAVVEEGSFRRAATRLHRSQPAVSQQIKSLEETLGHVLIERKTRTPTEAGRTAYERARSLLTSAEGLERELRDLDPAYSPELRVGTSDTTALYVLPPVVRAFSRGQPRTRLVIVNRPSRAIATQVLEGSLDLGIVTLPAEAPGLEEQALFRQRLVLAMPPGHPLAHRRRVTLESLRGEPFLLLRRDTQTGALLRRFFENQRFEPHVALDTGSFEVIKRFVAEGTGLSFLPDISLTGGGHNIATANVDGLPAIDIGVVRRHGAYLSAAAAAFLELVERAVKKRRGKA